LYRLKTKSSLSDWEKWLCMHKWRTSIVLFAYFSNSCFNFYYHQGSSNWTFLLFISI
jgi:hypothetical protein